LLIIGSPVKGKEKLLNDLKDKIKTFELNKNVTIIPFQNNIWRFYDLIDLAVVPSTIPESFGLVALEAMLSKKAVIASNEGGLSEIISHDETGILFKMNDEKELEAAVFSLIENKELSSFYGEQGYKRALDKFTLKAFIEKFEKLYNMEFDSINNN
jgi:glycosyltransferase involved in cell wall biosynthesis